MTAADYLQYAMAIAYAVIVIVVALGMVAGAFYGIYKFIEFMRSL